MAALERIMQMKQQGFTEPQMIDALKQEGVSPKEIEEGLSQSNIKSAINMPAQPGMQQPIANLNSATAEMSNQNMAMQPSITQSNNPQQAPPQPVQQTPQQFQQAPPQPQAQYEQAPTQPTEQYEQPTEQYSPEQYPPQQYYDEYAPQSSDIATINDISEQIVEEKTAALKSQISSLINFKEDISLEIGKINERVNRMENIFNELQIAILKKIGEYGKSVQNIEKEMHATQDSFSKMVNPLTDNIRELQKITDHETKHKSEPKPETKHKPLPKPKAKSKAKSKPRGKNKINFEDYLR